MTTALPLPPPPPVIDPASTASAAPTAAAAGEKEAVGEGAGTLIAAAEADCEGVALPVTLAERLSYCVGSTDGEGDDEASVAETLMEAVLEGEKEAEACIEGVIVAELLALGEDVGEALRDTDAEAAREVLAVPLRVCEGAEVLLGLPTGEGEREVLAVPDADGETDDVTLALPVALPLGEADVVELWEPVDVSLDELLGAKLVVGVNEGEGSFDA